MLQHDEQGFLTGRRLERDEIVDRLDDLLDELRALRRDLSGADSSGAPVTLPPGREASPAPISARPIPAPDARVGASAPRVAEPPRPLPERDARGRFIARETRLIERSDRVVERARERERTITIDRRAREPVDRVGPRSEARREIQPGAPAPVERAQRERPPSPTPASRREAPPQAPRERDARGRFTRDSEARAESDRLKTDSRLSGAIRDLGARISGLAAAAPESMERGDPLVQGFNEVAQPLARGFGKILSATNDRRERRERVTWYRRFFSLFRDQHREEVLEERRQRRLLENLNRRRSDDGGGLAKWLPLLLAPLAALGSMLGGLGGKIAGSIASGAARLIGPVVAGILSAVGLKKLAERLTGRAPTPAGGPRRRSGGADDRGRRGGGPRPGPEPDRPRGGRFRQALRGARSLPGIGALLGLGFMASDVYASETDETATRAEKDVSTGRAIGGGLGAGGGALAGGLTGAAIAGPVGAVIGALAGAYFGGSAGEPIGEKVGGWVSELRGSDLVATIGDKWQYAVDFTTALSERAGSDLSALWTQTSTALQAQFSAFGATLGAGWDATRATLESAWLSASAAWSSASEWMRARWESVASASEAIWSGISERFAGVSEWAREQFSGIKSAFDGAAEWVKSAWSDTKAAAQGAIEQATALAESAATATVEAASTANAWVAEQTGVDVAANVQAAADATAKAAEDASAAVRGAWESVTGWFGGAKEAADRKQIERAGAVPAQAPVATGADQPAQPTAKEQAGAAIESAATATVEAASTANAWVAEQTGVDVAANVQAAADATAKAAEDASAAVRGATASAPVSVALLPAVERAIQSASEQTGVSEAYLRATALAGSGGQPKAVTPEGAVGLYPFTEAGGRAAGLVGEGFDRRRDPAASALAAAQLSIDNRRAMVAPFMASGLGAPTDLDVWMAHQMGAAAWTRERRAEANGGGAEARRSAEATFAQAATQTGLSVQNGNLIEINEAALAADLGVGGVLRETATASTSAGAISDVATLSQAMESSALALQQTAARIDAPSHADPLAPIPAVEKTTTSALNEIKRAGDEATSAWRRLKDRLSAWLDGELSVSGQPGAGGAAGDGGAGGSVSISGGAGSNGAGPGIDLGAVRQAASGMAQGMSNHLYSQTQSAISQGVKYGFGSKDSKSGSIDCSGWVSEINRSYIDSIASEAENPQQVKQAKQLFTGGGGGAAHIVENLSKATGELLTNESLTVDALKDGMIIGEDNGQTKWDAGRFKGIDHITQVVRDPSTGEMMISQSSGKKGVNLVRAEDYLAQKNKSGTKLYGVDTNAAISQAMGIKAGAAGMTSAAGVPAGASGSAPSDSRTALISAMREAGITNPNEQAAFMAQMHHESGGFKAREESFKYRSAERIMDVSKTARSKGRAAVEAARQQGPEAVAELMYGGRMGNTQPGDGYKFRGRGFVQLTGRANYERASKDLGIDLVSNPDMAADPAVAAKLATWYWKSKKGLSEAAQRGDTRRVTKLINGGENGLPDRINLTQRYLAEAQSGKLSSGAAAPLPTTTAIAAAPSTVADPVIDDEALKADLSAGGILRQTASANAVAGAQSDVKTLTQATEASALAVQQVASGEPQKPALTTARRDEMRAELSAMRQRAEAQLRRPDLDPEIREKYRDLLAQVGEKEAQVNQAAVSDGPGTEQAPGSAGVAQTPGSPDPQASAPSPEPITGLFASMMSQIPGTSPLWREAADARAPGPSTADRAPLDPITALLQPLGGAASGLLSGLPGGAGVTINAGLQSALGSLTGGLSGVLSGSLGRLRGLGDLGRLGGSGGHLGDLQDLRSFASTLGAPEAALSSLIPGLSGAVGQVGQIPATLSASIGSIGTGALSTLGGALAQPINAVASAMPRVPASIQLPRTSEPSAPPPDVQVPLALGSSGPQSGALTPEIARDVSDRRIAHIVTGAYSSGGL